MTSTPPTTGRALHLFVRSRIELALGPRPWKWLAAESGVATSTLSSQVNRPKFSLDTLVRIAAALDRPIAYFLPDEPGQSDVERKEALEELEALVRQARRTLGARREQRSHVPKTGS